MKRKRICERMEKNNFLVDLIKADRLNKILSKVKNSIDNRYKKDVLDKLKRNKKNSRYCRKN